MTTINVIYIIGEGRSGSTIVARILGTLDGVTCLLEFRAIWDRGLINNARCSCGKRFYHCMFWRPIQKHAFRDDPKVKKVWQLRNAVESSRHFPKYYSGIYDEKFKENLDQYKKWMHKLYFSLFEIAGDHIFVDSSKFPVGALILNELPGIKVFVLHIVRDSRGVVFSNARGYYGVAKESFMLRWSPWQTTTGWVVRNIICESLSHRLPYQRVIYDEFARKPRTVLQKVVDQLEPIQGQQLPFVDEHLIDLGEIHTMSGNPGQFSTGVTEIWPDDAWKEGLPVGTRWLATVAGYPLLRRYGFPDL